MKRKNSSNTKSIASYFSKRASTCQSSDHTFPPLETSIQNQPPTQPNEQNDPQPQPNEQHDPQNLPPPQSSQQNSSPANENTPQNQEDERQQSFRARLSSIDVVNLPQDPGNRRKISDFHPDDVDVVRREYIQRGPCQPEDHAFPFRLFGTKRRRFVKEWFKSHKPWLEYSVENDAAFCFVCYLFKSESLAGGDAFVSSGYRGWNKPDALQKHIGGHMSAHNQAMGRLEDFKNQKASIVHGLEVQTEEVTSAYRTRLEASITCLKWLLKQGLLFRGHDEKETSFNRGNFLELLKLLSEHDPDYSKVVFKNAPGNCQLTSPKIQKDIINACAKETTKSIIEDLGDGFFSILADESSDISDKEQLALCLRYVNKRGEVNERLLGVVHVANTTSLNLKNAIESLLMEHSLSLSRVRGQGYDGASNMRGSINGLRSLIEQENQSAYYVHCFAHQLQLTQVAVAKNSPDCVWFFDDVIAPLLNFVGGSPKRKEFLRDSQKEHVAVALSSGEIETGSGLNQELGLSRPGDTRWGSHFKTILNVLDLYPSILDSLDAITDVSTVVADRYKAGRITIMLASFDFIFLAHMMVGIFGITNELNLALQKRDQDIVNAMYMVDVTKKNLQKLRDDGFSDLMVQVTSFMEKYGLDVLKMEDIHAPMTRRFRNNKPPVTNFHHFRVEVFLSVLDLQLQELENRFSEVSKELLVCMSCFNPSNGFSKFDKGKLVQLARFYPNDFPSTQMFHLAYSLENFIVDIRGDERFWNVTTLNELSMKLVETEKNDTHATVYLLLKLVLLLPVATANVERVFSGMNYVKDKLRNSIGDQMLCDCLVTYLEKDLFENVSMESIITRFQNMETRREQL